MDIGHWLYVWSGLSDASGAPYLWWSGIGAFLVFGGALWRILNCHAQGCKRIGMHHVVGTGFKTCRKHHPTGGNTVEQIHAAHRRATT